MVLIDSGPLVALIHADDRQHTRCTETLKTLTDPMSTVWPAFTEAMYLLGFSWQAQDALWEFVRRGALTFQPLDQSDVERMGELMKKYRDLPMDLVDAALVRVAEREKIRRIFTLERADFLVYRPRGFESFELLPQELDR